ncbi:MAG TPA: BLUF domain-containing protein [Sphingomonas sp.]|jgi:hypothetical protein|nr:BLUF domain-containing protein [Sphingomonas sp.]
MIRLLYISTARAILAPAQLDEVLRTSTRNNGRVGVSGLLIVGGRRFLQALEGPEAAVMTTFERIRADPRHFAVVVLGRTAINERLFGSWAMGYQPGGTLSGGGTIAAQVASLIAPITDATVQAYFNEFARQHAA